MDPGPSAGRGVLDAPTLVLNRSWLPVHVTVVRRAMAMLFRGTAQAIDPESLVPHDFAGWIGRPGPIGSARLIRTPSRQIVAPEIVQLRSYDRLPVFEAPFTRAGLLRRDEHRCQYCGSRPPTSQLTIDHVVPRAHGGRTSWENCVAACVRCNSRKGDRSPAQAGLRMQRAPRAPRWSPYLHVRRSDWPASWMQFAVDAKRSTRTWA